jgi:hypothetical protein
MMHGVAVSFGFSKNLNSTVSAATPPEVENIHKSAWRNLFASELDIYF